MAIRAKFEVLFGGLPQVCGYLGRQEVEYRSGTLRRLYMYTMLCCAVLCCAVLCCAVLYLLRCKATKETVIFIFHSVSAV